MNDSLSRPSPPLDLMSKTVTYEVDLAKLRLSHTGNLPTPALKAELEATAALLINPWEAVQ